MKLVIDISEHLYDMACNYPEMVISTYPLCIRKGTPLPEKMSNKEWIDFLSEQFDISRTSARNMLHCMMRIKEKDNLKKQLTIVSSDNDREREEKLER